MSRAWFAVVLMCLLVAAQCLAEEAEKHAEQPAQESGAHAGQQPPQPPQQTLTAIRLPSESLSQLSLAAPALRAVRALGLNAAKTAARALADNIPSSLSLSSSTVYTLAVAGAVVAAVVGIGAVLGLLSMFGMRPCYLFGNCDMYSAHAYATPNTMDTYLYSQPAMYPVTYAAKSYDGVTNELPYTYDPSYQSAQLVAYPTSNSVATNANAYQKRSLEYVGPILKMLSNAYEKYNHPGQSKSIEKSTSAASMDGKLE